MNYKSIRLLIENAEAEIKTGPFGTQLKASEYTDVGIPVLNVKNLGYSRVVSEKLDHVNQTTLDRLSMHVLQSGDIVFGRKGAVDRHAFISVKENGWMQGSDCIRLRLLTDSYNPRFLSYYFMTNKHRSFMEMMCSHGTTMASLNQRIIELIEIPDLERKIQDKIVSILERVDSLIDNNARVNQNLQQQAFALFDRLLSESVNGMRQLNEIAELNPKHQLSKGTVARCIDMAQLSTSGTFPSGWEMKPYNGGMKFSNGNTIIARITPCLENGKTAFIDFLDESEVAFGSTEYIVLAAKDPYPAVFFYCLARYPAFVDYAVKNMNGSSGRQRVSADIRGKSTLPSIGEAEIALFKEAVTPMFRAIRNNSLENMHLAALRDTLLPRLMTGELDVSELDI